MGKTSNAGSKIKNFFRGIKFNIIWKINNSRIRKLESTPERFDVKLEHKNKVAVRKFIKKCEKELSPLYKKSADATNLAEARFQKELKKFDLKHYWKYRQTNHAYAKSLFAEQNVEEAKQKHATAISALETARQEKIASLNVKREKFISEYKFNAEECQEAAREYAVMLDEKQAETDAMVDRLREVRKKRVAAKREECAKKIAKITEKTPSTALTLEDGVVLDVKHLCMYFGGLHAVEDLSFDVKEGEIFGLIGPNGAGKTTVFNCITQFYKCTAGELTFRNIEGEVINLKNYPVHNIICEGIARTFQNVEVIKEISVLENLLVAVTRKYTANLFEQALSLPILPIEEERLKTRALKLLEALDLLAYKDWLAWGLPYGILKKVEIARALMTNPKLLILDEPAAGLNNTETAQLAISIKKIRDEFGCSILLVEHDMSLVMSICDRICAISFGKMLALGTPEEIQANKQVQEAYLGVAEEENSTSKEEDAQ